MLVKAQIRNSRKSISRVLYDERDGYSSRSAVTNTLLQPTQKRTETVHMLFYLVLLPVGFTLPTLLPAPRCALTAPFHPYSPEGKRYIFCGTFPKVAPAGCYPAPCFLEPGLSSPLGLPQKQQPSDFLLLVRWQKIKQNTSSFYGGPICSEIGGKRSKI